MDDKCGYKAYNGPPWRTADLLFGRRIGPIWRTLRSVCPLPVRHAAKMPASDKTHFRYRYAEYPP
jgi:hypothetical protein